MKFYFLVVCAGMCMILPVKKLVNPILSSRSNLFMFCVLPVWVTVAYISMFSRIPHCVTFTNPEVPNYVSYICIRLPLDFKPVYLQY